MHFHNFSGGILKLTLSKTLLILHYISEEYLKLYFSANPLPYGCFYPYKNSIIALLAINLKKDNFETVIPNCVVNYSCILKLVTDIILEA